MPKYFLKNNRTPRSPSLFIRTTTTEGLSEGLQGRARRQGGLDDRHRGKLRGFRTDHRLPHRQDEVDRRDVFFNITTPKFAAQAIKKNAEIGWKPLHFLNNVSASIGSVIKPAGFENAQDIISSQYFKDPTDAQWKDDAGMKAWNEFLDKYYPEANRADASVMYAYNVAQGLVHVLKACGDNLTRAMKSGHQASKSGGHAFKETSPDFARLACREVKATLGGLRLRDATDPSPANASADSELRHRG
jgi:hypothetical protein